MALLIVSRGARLTRARLLGIIAGIALLAVLAVALFHDRLPTLAPSSGQSNIEVTLNAGEPTWTLAPTATIAANTLAPPLPAFSDWRVAYLDEDTRLHVISSDGKTLVFCGRRNENYDVYSIPSAGGAETRLTTAEGIDDGPEYTPDGEKIHFKVEGSTTGQGGEG